MNLIANTGIQYFTVPLEIDLDDTFNMLFHEYSDEEDHLKLEIVHKFPEEDVLVKKCDLFDCNYLTDDDTGRVGRLENDGKFKALKWEDIKDDFLSLDYQPIDETGCFPMRLRDKDLRLEIFEKHWLPFPFFKVINDRSDFGPINWCRFKLIPDASDSSGTIEGNNVKKYNLLLAFDTRTVYEGEGFEEEDLQEKPVFVNDEKSKDFALCDNEFSLVDFCTRRIYENSNGSETEIDCDWVNEALLKYFHSCTKEEFEKKDLSNPKMSYMAQFIFVLRYIQQLKVLPKITLFPDKRITDEGFVNVDFGVVDLVVDIGNSRTCAVLFDGSKFTDVMPLGLQNFSNPIANQETIELNGKEIAMQGTVENVIVKNRNRDINIKKIKEGKVANYQQLKLNRYYESFDMRLVFSEVDFGNSLKRGSSQFIWPSMVRLGAEANELIHKAKNQSTEDIEKITTFSSPKRFLWDGNLQKKEWEFVTLSRNQSGKPIRIKGISEQLNSDGSLNEKCTIGGTDKIYPRKTLMTFAFIEILAQAKMQINSFEYRHKWQPESKPRRIDRIIITCPPAMSRKEQKALRLSAEHAVIILDRFFVGTYNEVFDEKKVRKNIKVIPSVIDSQNIEEYKEWIYDEATCAQFVYLYAQITDRYRNNCEEYFDLYGKYRNDLGNYKKKSLTIGSVDIGAGTTDLMIAAYKYEEAAKQCKLTPVPLFWESFYKAGDDLLKDLIKKVVIEKCIQNHLINLGKNDIEKLIRDFFGKDGARLSKIDRQIRSEFNLQVSVLIALHCLELLNKNKTETEHLLFKDILVNNKPTKRVCDHFKEHFGFELDELQYNYDKDIVSKIVERTFDSLISKISAMFSYYDCDIVLLSGRPASLKPLEDLFLKYYAVSPNRLITLNGYKVGTWYPFHDGKGFFKDAKSIVAVGAMVGNYASTRGGLKGFSLDLSELKTKMLPTTEYFVQSEFGKETAFISPKSSTPIKVALSSRESCRIWTRQLDTHSYPTRPFYMLGFNKDEIEKKKKSIGELEKLSPYEFCIIREDYSGDKESLKIDSVSGCNGEELDVAYFSLQVQSMSESENYWLDSGEFENLDINHR